METAVTYLSSPLGPIQLEASDVLQKAVFCAEEPVTIPSVTNPVLQHACMQLNEYFSGQRRDFNLPLAQKGTGFQQRVWELLLQIPFGHTLSYQALAQQYGDLKAIRSVAAANGKNNLAIIVPCHRVIGSNRSLTGYAGGLWRKQWLLDHEARWYGGTHQLTLL